MYAGNKWCNVEEQTYDNLIEQIGHQCCGQHPHLGIAFTGKLLLAP